MQRETRAVTQRTTGSGISLHVHSFLESSAVNGPGERAVIWLQGCSIGCPRCWNPATHLRSAGSEWAVEKVLAWLDLVRSRIEIWGLTISGGEPLEQAPGLVQLVEGVRDQFPDLSIGLFSGYSETELDRGNYLCFPSAVTVEKRELWRRIRQTLDFAVLGRYNALAPSRDPLITSRNQRLRLYSSRYSPADFQPQLVELTIDGHGLTQITGFPVRGSVTE
jgi:anaerobic ribonucleoside-triphosphate reductase activating protein